MSTRTQPHNRTQTHTHTHTHTQRSCCGPSPWGPPNIPYYGSAKKAILTPHDTNTHPTLLQFPLPVKLSRRIGLVGIMRLCCGGQPSFRFLKPRPRMLKYKREFGAGPPHQLFSLQPDPRFACFGVRSGHFSGRIYTHRDRGGYTAQEQRAIFVACSCLPPDEYRFC